jgi:hypothetical protein
MGGFYPEACDLTPMVRNATVLDATADDEAPCPFSRRLGPP